MVSNHCMNYSRATPIVQDTNSALFAELVRRFRASDGASLSDRWMLLEAAHIVGQPVLRTHWRSHRLMLGLACSERDWAEATGQIFRLALVPLGHLMRRLPAGNTGRSNVSAFQPMPVDERIAAVIMSARASSTKYLLSTQLRVLRVVILRIRPPDVIRKHLTYLSFQGEAAIRRPGSQGARCTPAAAGQAETQSNQQDHHAMPTGMQTSPAPRVHPVGHAPTGC